MFSIKMASVVFGLVSLLIYLSTINTVSSIQCNVQLYFYKPKGFKVIAVDTPGITKLSFKGYLNIGHILFHPANFEGIDFITFDVTEPRNGKWVGEDRNLVLPPNGIIYYNASMIINGTECVVDDYQMIDEYLDARVDWHAKVPGKPKICDFTETNVWRGGIICSGDTIFEENFDSIREQAWRVEQYFPIRHPEHPFVSFQKTQVSVANGTLQITATPLQSIKQFKDDEWITSRTHDLSDSCTGQVDECKYTPSGNQIVPPIVSGRLTSVGFAFKYGVVTVRAKMPLGDWLYPEILLEPMEMKYGSKEYESGAIRIACARGNSFLEADFADFSNSMLFGGPIMSKKCPGILEGSRHRQNAWGNEFHNYTLHWTPEFIDFSVDGISWLKVESPYITKFPAVCDDIPLEKLKRDQSAPFNKLFYIALGVGAGGTLFPDSVTPLWKNSNNKVLLDFWWQNRFKYYSWNDPTLHIDYIKVVAL